VIDRVAGSHRKMVFLGDPARAVTVPVHAGRDLKPGTLRSIIRRAWFSVEEFSELLYRSPDGAPAKSEGATRSAPGLRFAPSGLRLLTQYEK
jgi:predicted RNA binding protein YcfA (HicA-like mRNA interferase family)